jgi:hypothetical protein
MSNKIYSQSEMTNDGCRMTDLKKHVNVIRGS